MARANSLAVGGRGRKIGGVPYPYILILGKASKHQSLTFIKKTVLTITKAEQELELEPEPEDQSRHILLGAGAGAVKNRMALAPKVM